MAEKDKRNWPLDMLKSRRKMLPLLNENIKESYVKDAYFSFAPADIELPYYFIVKEFNANSNPNTYRVYYRPTSNNDPSEGTGLMHEGQLLVYFKDWVNYVNEYVEQLKLDVDSVSEGYKDEFFEAFELVDEDANTHSYPLPVQLLLDAYFEKLTARLEQYKESNELSEVKQAEIDTIIQDVKELRESQTQLSKQKVLEKLSGVWAKMRKAGLKLLGEAKTELLKEAMKQGAKGLIDNPMGPVDFVTNLFGGSGA